jgi:general secretion pathway protein F
MRVQLNVVQGRGAPQRVEREAASLDDARQQMVRQGYTVLSLQPVGIRWGQLVRLPLHGKAAGLDIEVFVEQLRDLLAAGLSVIEGLETLERGAAHRVLPVLRQLTQRLRGGHRLSEALAAEPAFPTLLVALVRSSELTSNLTQALSRFLDHQQRVAEIRHKVVSVAIYPLLVSGVGSAVLVFLLFYVMPRFARVFEGMVGTLPWSARAMVWWSQWLHAHGAVFVGMVVAVISALAMLLGTPTGRARISRRLLDTALLREHLRTYFLARWYRATGMLVEGGIPLPEALALSTGLLPAGLQAAGAAVERGVRDGYGPTVAHAAAGMATPAAEQLMRAGERTGDLGAVLIRIAHFHEAEVSRSLERAMRTLEPAVMVLIGLGVGTVVVLMYLPIFELAAAIQ